LDFILDEVHQGAKEGHYRDTLLLPEQLRGWRKQLNDVIKFSRLERYADRRFELEVIRAKLWVYGRTSDDRVGYMLVSERFPGTADSEVELYQVGVRKDRRGHGHGQHLVELFIGCVVTLPL
jgi:ribosomal protein S18 acetylase RimI-like enzyme